MVLVTLNVPSEVRERLKLEDNQSQLVTELLMNYFKDVNAEDIAERIKLLETEKELKKDAIDMRIKELEVQLEEKQKADLKKGEDERRKNVIKKAQEKWKKEAENG